MSSYTPRKKPKKTEQTEKVQAAPWHKREDESDKAFAAFDLYRKMGIERNLVYVARVIYGEFAEKNFWQIEEWAEQHEWEKRAMEWDHHERENHEQILEEAARHAKIKLAESLGEVTDKGIAIAMGELKEVTREQQQMIKEIWDRGNVPKVQPAQNVVNNFNNMNISAPDLPKEVSGQYNAEEADFEELPNDLEKMIPEDLRQKRNSR